MNRIKLLILLVIICISTVNAQLLWKISGHGLKQNSYLLGTHHLISISFLDSIPGVYPAFNKSKIRMYQPKSKRLLPCPILLR